MNWWSYVILFVAVQFFETQCIVELFDVKYYRDLKVWVRGHWRWFKLLSFKSLVWFPIRLLWRTLVSFARKSRFFIPHLYLAPLYGVIRRNFAKMFDTHKTRMIGLPWWRNYDNMLSHFDGIPERDGQKDRPTELITIKHDHCCGF